MGEGTGLAVFSFQTPSCWRDGDGKDGAYMILYFNFNTNEFISVAAGPS
jgi:hypothetical protein